MINHPLTNTEATRARCTECGEDRLVQSFQDELIPYGSGNDHVLLTVSVPVWSCDACGEAFTGAEAEDIRHEAVCRHLRRLTPAEIRAIRDRERLSQDGFARLTGFGLASIKRWEGGNQIQSEAPDRYLRLLSEQSTVRRLAAIVTKLSANVATVNTFRTDLSDEVREDAMTFQLCRTPVPLDA